MQNIVYKLQAIKQIQKKEIEIWRWGFQIQLEKLREEL